MKNKVSDWMTRQPVTIDDGASIIEAIHLMKEKNVRRLPVMHEGRLIAEGSLDEVANDGAVLAAYLGR